MARLALVSVILFGQFAALEAGLRMFGGSEADSGFQSLFQPDDRIGYRLRPGATTRFTTAEFSTDLAINAQGVRDAEPIGPKAPGERRVLILGDSFVFAVQVPLAETMGEQVEARLNELDSGHRWRAINGGVQGYGPVEQWLFYRTIASAFEPDVVLIVVSVANDAIEAYDARAKLELGRVPDGTSVERGQARFRQVVRSSVVLQRVRVRADQVRARTMAATTERPLAAYLEPPPAFVSDGLRVAARAFGRIAMAARASGATVGVILMPARFQTHDADYERVLELSGRGGGRLVRHAATARFTDALKPLGEPMLDLLPVFAADADPPQLHFIRNTHLSAEGHRVAADAIARFVWSHASGGSSGH